MLIKNVMKNVNPSVTRGWKFRSMVDMSLAEVMLEVKTIVVVGWKNYIGLKPQAQIKLYEFE